MFVMTYSQARQNFSSFLNQTKKDGIGIIKRSDGTSFKVQPVYEENISQENPFAELSEYAASAIAPKLKGKITLQEIIEMMHEEQDERADRIITTASGSTPEKFFNILNK